jgi:choline dehydrogenase
VRQNTGLVYLTEQVRNRPNLKISGDVLVDRVLFDRGRAVGVVTASGAEIPAGEVILSSGAYGTPAILLRSGVGPAADLAAFGIDLVVDLPVGQRLQEQPFYYNAYALKTDALDMRPAVGALLWSQSSDAHGDELDMHIAVTHLMPPEYSPTGGAIALSVAVVKPDARGTVRLRSRDPREQPEIDCNLLGEERDARRMLEGVRLARKLGRHPALSRFLELEILPGATVGDDQLADAIASNLASYGHPTASAPMGGPQDPWAVVDSRGAVKGIDGLRVVDASIVPGAVSVAPNPTTIMIAERIAKTVYAAQLGQSARQVPVA